MYVIDYKHILVFNREGFDVFRKLLNDDELTQSETQCAWQMYRILSLGGTEDADAPLAQTGGEVFSIRDDQQALCFGPVEYDIIIKMLKGDSDLNDEENRRADQMYNTLRTMDKARQERREYKRPVRRVQRPQRVSARAR